ncbi:type III secretion system protein [Erwinia psidii]|uniref:Type III secretion system protein n=1 Tax=Erwinia psidii TaxID=69224 RepID=A0A3N6SL70_9GAMM|nr:type III secretion system protein [Erwinia psidii]MCX8957612.1 type III secretion system protein [Erwinia psidii]MCX8960666.1 type III secretion system protein [Erwinia psidii]MCX8964089.1 type III secretion system protein [Erwinia psidii]RQM39571.1 type III secretion system protein [Erwinia psidii]
MSEMLPADDPTLRWLRWWCIDSWLAADEQWRQAAFYQLDDTRLAALAQTHHPMICQQLQLTTRLSPVDEELLNWLEITAEQRQLALSLAAEVCWRGSTGETLSPDQQRWCRRVAQAMRPGLWLTDAEGLPVSDGDTNGLWLLRQRAGPDCWGRLRLAFPQEKVLAVEQLTQLSAFPSRLLPLWQAVFWYASQEPQC